MGDEDSTTRQAGGDEAATRPGDKWGDPISEERQAELRALFERQQELFEKERARLLEHPLAWLEDSKEQRGEDVFKHLQLTGADVYWLAEVSRRDGFGRVPNLRLAGVKLFRAQLAGANLSMAHLAEADLQLADLMGSNLRGAHLEEAMLNDAQLAESDLRNAQLARVHFVRSQLKRANFLEADLEEANLGGADLEEANLGGADLEGARLEGAQLKGADLMAANLKGAELTSAQLTGANLIAADLEKADLRGAQLEGANLARAQLVGADLTMATFDKSSVLNHAVLTGASLDQVTYDGVKLTVLDWTLVPVLGDELAAKQLTDEDGRLKDRKDRLDDFTAAVRANRVLAVTLRSQGMNEDADRYAYRAQLLQRTLLRLQRRWGAAFGSWLLDLVSGYGYKPVRSIIAYVAIIVFFAGLYLLNGQFAAPHLRWDEALVLSISSFHGRGFFTTGISLGDTLARLAAGEAIIGLLIEITFIATFTQRFFAR